MITWDDWVEFGPYLPFSLLMDWSVEVDEKWHFITLPIYMLLAIPALFFGILVLGPIWILGGVLYWLAMFPYNTYKLFKR